MSVHIEMIGVLLQGIIALIIIDKISNIKQNRNVYLAKVICLCLNLVIWYFIKEVGSWRYTVGVVLDILNFSFYTVVLKRQRFLFMFVSVMAANILNAFFGILVAVLTYMTLDMEKTHPLYLEVVLFGYFFRFILLYIMGLLENKFHLSRLLEKGKIQIIVIAVGIFIQIIRQPIYLISEYRENLYVQTSIIVLITTAAFGILWFTDKYFTEREQRLLWEDNVKMAKRLHKSKEILPILDKTLAKIKLNYKSEELNELLNEVHQLCKEQIYESRNEEMQYKSFPSTGIHILDEQIQLYGKEAADKGINFDIFVNISMSEALKKHDISKLDFLQLIGNLMRNAFRAVERNQENTGNILLVMGCVNEVLELEIYDNGDLFPMYILDEFGKIGNTNGGTGYGIAEILDILKDYNATYKLTEYEDDMSFSKGIGIIWNEKDGRWIESFRGNQISKDSILESENLEVADSSIG
ncbi:GHKL domain-containing protein [Konateibacter massiliensis]|uniref:GHKL domain-containing protein n=1 Tax=Konateibacter massiliensis TaxID=2002841 RepID=UPI000C159372|nr:GHKL domain-containing protein [Konateibacter massiliensis]